MTDLAERIEAAEGPSREEVEWCRDCFNPVERNHWKRLIAWLAHSVVVLTPTRWTACGWISRLWFRLLPYAGVWAYSCHCDHAAALRARAGE